MSAYDDDNHRYVRGKYVTECGCNLLRAYNDDNHRYVRDKYVTECGCNSLTHLLIHKFSLSGSGLEENILITLDLFLFLE